MWSFGNDSAKNLTVFDSDNSSSGHTHNHKSNLILHEGPTFGINGSFGSAEKKLSINFSEAKTKFSLSLHYNSDNYLFVDGQESLHLKI